ncbi:mechanosensitive ion channel family protein [Candidatus Acetothermia bacterium]|nr:MAG: mechanosensitive ion channel family protein [Candidatus Acetothermia bacterium]HHK66961.1 mechanosensitive ion channel [Candidatus Acetothermia bacterium]
MTILKSMFYGNAVWRWLLSAGVIVGVWFALHVLLRILINRLRGFVAHTPGRLDDLLVDLLEKTRFLFILVLALYAGSLVLSLPVTARTALRTLFIIALLLQAGYWGNGLVAFFTSRFVKRKLKEDAAVATSLSALGFIAKFVIWAIVVLIALDNMGIDITALIAGLGIGGIAIALAVQNILSDLFASLSIIVDKPFVIGDFIVIGDLRGTVERIGLKTTRIRSLSGEQIVFSNSDLLSSRVRNYKRMYERRISFSIGVTYDTNPELLERIPKMIEKIVSSQPKVRFDRCHFKSFGDFALIFETVYYMLVPDYNAYMDTQQAINLSIAREFAEEGIEFAYPTQTIYLAKGGPS